MVGLNRTSWDDEPRPPLCDLSILDLPKNFPIALKKFSRTDSGVANALVEHYLADPEIHTVCTVGSYAASSRHAYASFAISQKSIAPFSQSPFEGIGGNAYISEMLALFSGHLALLLVIAPTPHRRAWKPISKFWTFCPHK